MEAEKPTEEVKPDHDYYRIPELWTTILMFGFGIYLIFFK